LLAKEQHRRGRDIFLAGSTGSDWLAFSGDGGTMIRPSPLAAVEQCI
jgi:hypothetical protein